MIILGIDPGTHRLGYSVLEYDRGAFRVLAADVIESAPKTPQNDVLERIAKDLARIIDIHKPGILALEKLFFFKNNKTAFRVSEARGVILLTGQARGLPIYEYTPLEVKMALTGYGKADKAQVQYMVKNILSLDTMPRLDDITDAMAVAITCAHRFVGERHI